MNLTTKNLLNSIDTSLYSQITSDSREIIQDSIFVAISGTNQDSHEYLPEAEEKGAILLIGEISYQPKKAQYIQVKDSREFIARLASKFYHHPSQSMIVVGVTGTSGKTTTTYLIESVLKQAGHQVGLIGTVECRFNDHIIPSSLTTPGPVELQKILFQMKNEGCTAVVMEVSSHSLKQKRVTGINFDVSVFTNLSPEHLDFHPNMEDYFQSKSILFKEMLNEASLVGKNPKIVINCEDEYGKRLIEEEGLSDTYCFEIKKSIHKKSLTIGLDRISGDLFGISFQSPLTGDFNASNIAAAIQVGLSLNIEPQKISNGINQLKFIPGRLERVENSKGIQIWVDYAHKPDALEKVLKTLNQLKGSHRMITVFGCGGDRDRKKRPLMGQIAFKNSDYVWVTSDNPRTEKPGDIIKEILDGIPQLSGVHVIEDRRQAIHEAIQFAERGDLVLIAGKGHENYQILGKNKIHFDDREVALEIL